MKVVFLVVGCALLAVVILYSVAMSLPRVRERQDLRAMLSRMRLSFLLQGSAVLLLAICGENRLLHSVACGLGLAGTPILLVEVVKIFRNRASFAASGVAPAGKVPR